MNSWLLCNKRQHYISLIPPNRVWIYLWLDRCECQPPMSLFTDSQGHSEGSTRRQGEAETDAEEPATLHLRAAARAGGRAPLDEEGRFTCWDQCEGQDHKYPHLDHQLWNLITQTPSQLFPNYHDLTSVKNLITRSYLPIKNEVQLATD